MLTLIDFHRFLDPTIGGFSGAPNCSISDYGGVHYHEGGWQTLANSTAKSILALVIAFKIDELCI